MSGHDDADQLQHIFETQQSLTTWHEMAVQSMIENWRALREGDENHLRAWAGWDGDRSYIPDNLAEKISMTFGDMLFGEDPIIKSAQTVAKQLDQARRAKVEATQQAEGTMSPVASTESDVPERGAAPTAGETDTGAPNAVQATEEELETAAGPTEQSQYDLPHEEFDEGTGDDQDRLDNIVEANELSAELYSAEITNSSEGEVWWRIYRDMGQSDYPIIEWHSRSHVRPLYRGRKLLAAAFVSEIHREEIQDQWVVWRSAEIHAAGLVRNILYKGTPANLGSEMPLTSRSETEMLEPEWEHDLGIMCGRIYNKLGRDRRVGVSDYHNVAQMLLSLNEATTIGHENMRLTAKKRIAIPREAVGEDGTFDASEDVLIMDEPLDDVLGARTGGGKFAVLEYNFDALALIEWKLDLVATILSRVGIVAEFASAGGGTRSSGGGGVAALSGTALRMRLIPTTLAAKGKARPWDNILPKILMLAQQLDSLPEQRGGFGRNWLFPDAPPSVERGEPLPTDESEETQRHVTAVSGQIESRRTAIAELHPTWDEDQVQQELNEIQREQQLFGAAQPMIRKQGGPPNPTVGLGAGIVDTSG